MVGLKQMTLVAALCGVLGCPGDDTTSESQGASETAGPGTDGGCTPGTLGCTCENGSCGAGLVCAGTVCEIDMESENGPSTVAEASDASVDDTTASSSGTSEGTSSSEASGSEDTSSGDTGGMTCVDSEDCPRGEVCTAPAKSPGLPAGPFTCSSTCAGLGIDADVCTDDASCCGAFCNQGSCLAP